MKSYDLPTMSDRAKSFYGKAKVIECNGCKLLKSYDTIVCKIDSNGSFIKMWNGYSTTTMRHINAFLDLFGVIGGGKSWWNSLSVQR